MSNLCLDLPPDWRMHSPRWPIIYPPTSFYGFSVTWSASDPLQSVFLSQFYIGDCDCYLFAARVDYSRIKECMPSVPKGKFPRTQGYSIVFTIIEISNSDGGERQLVLQQFGNVVYSCDGTSVCHVPSKEVQESKWCYSKCRPNWKSSEAIWPTLCGLPMQFISQVNLEDSEVCRKYLSWNVRYFIFWGKDESASVYAITRQTSNLQTLEEHYAEEALRLKRRRTQI